MAVKYFCDLCNNEVKSPELLSITTLIEISPEITQNRYSISNYADRVTKSICLHCRINIIEHLKTLSTTASN